MLGATRVGGIDLNSARMRNTVAAVLALAVAPAGFTVGDLATKVHAITGQTDPDDTIRQAAYDLRKLRAKHLVDKPDRSHRYHVAPDAARIIAGLVAHRDRVIAPILAGVRSPRLGRKPSAWKAIDRDDEQIRVVRELLATYYQFDAAFVADHSAFTTAFGGHVTDWNEIIHDTLASYRDAAPAHAAVATRAAADTYSGTSPTPNGASAEVRETSASRDGADV